MLKRIKSECSKMINDYDSIVVDNQQDGSSLVTFKKKSNIYCFEVSSNYPFESPNLTINGINHSDFNDIKGGRFLGILKQITNMDCLCCESHLCKSNWSPAIRFENIISQIEQFRNIKQRIFLKLILENIQLKYLNKDINLESWLFAPL